MWEELVSSSWQDLNSILVYLMTKRKDFWASCSEMQNTQLVQHASMDKNEKLNRHSNKLFVHYQFCYKKEKRKKKNTEKKKTIGSRIPNKWCLSCVRLRWFFLHSNCTESTLSHALASRKFIYELGFGITKEKNMNVEGRKIRMLVIITCVVQPDWRWLRNI